MKSPLSSLRKLTGRHVAATIFTTAVLFAAATGCATLGLPEDRLMSCKSNDDCKSQDPKKPACANLRCVECQYDEDCAAGLCTDNQCKTFFKSAGATDPEDQPKNLDACLSRCNDDQACFNQCNEKWRPAPGASPDGTSKPDEKPQ